MESPATPLERRQRKESIEADYRRCTRVAGAGTARSRRRDEATSRVFPKLDSSGAKEKSPSKRIIADARASRERGQRARDVATRQLLESFQSLHSCDGTRGDTRAPRPTLM